MRTQDEVAAMSCPVCRVPLAMSDRQGIEIDYCPQCRGVWMDRGELDKVIERSMAYTAPASGWRGDDDDDDDDDDRRRMHGQPGYPPHPQQEYPAQYPPQQYPQQQYPY